MKEFNINDCIWVKLTDSGRAELKRQHDDLKDAFPNVEDYKPLKEDDDGFVKMQGWCLMSSFGHMMRPTFDPPFETVVRIDKLTSITES